MLGLNDDCMLGLASDLASSDGPARVEGAIDRVAAAACRSRVGRIIEAMFVGMMYVLW